MSLPSSSPGPGSRSEYYVIIDQGSMIIPMNTMFKLSFNITTSMLGSLPSSSRGPGSRSDNIIRYNRS